MNIFKRVFCRIYQGVFRLAMPFLPYREPVKLASVEEIPETLAGIREEDIPHMARNAAKEANPLYPVPLETDARELEGFYFAVMPKENKGERTE